jgi:hypothetical protein
MDQHVAKLIALGFAEEQAQQVVDFLGDRVYAGPEKAILKRGIKSGKVTGAHIRSD